MSLHRGKLEPTILCRQAVNCESFEERISDECKPTRVDLIAFGVRLIFVPEALGMRFRQMRFTAGSNVGISTACER